MRRSFLTKVTALGHGRDALDRLANHVRNDVTDVYDRHSYEREDMRIMTAVGEHILDLALGRKGGKVIKFGR